MEGPSDHEAKPRRHRRWEMSGPHETLQHLTPAPREPASVVFSICNKIIPGFKTIVMISTDDLNILCGQISAHKLSI